MKINWPLLALATGAFGIGITEFTPMNMLPLIADDLAVSIPSAGLLVSLCDGRADRCSADDAGPGADAAPGPARRIDGSVHRGQPAGGAIRQPAIPIAGAAMAGAGLVLLVVIPQIHPHATAKA